MSKNYVTYLAKEGVMVESKEMQAVVTVCNNDLCKRWLSKGSEVVIGNGVHDLYCSVEHYKEVIRGEAGYTRIRKKCSVGGLDAADRVMSYN